ncbi:hypothetical protein ACN47A_14535 [Myxococcus fulvus]|uniref:hypothetical protein n=1 Tax=Myxococcus fulvus TaxID=33 RepID=UPI003B9BFFF2
MTIVGVRSIALWAGFVLMTACGGPLPEEAGSVEDSYDVMSDEMNMSDEGISVESDAAELYECELTVIEACQPHLRTCGVRCCDGRLFRAYNMACGGCLPFAYNVCGSSGPWHVRWTD